jgi:adenylate cyclase
MLDQVHIAYMQRSVHRSNPVTEKSRTRPDRNRADELPEHLERDFDRRALAPRLIVLVLLGLAAILDYGHGPRTGHWIALGGYGLTTIAMAISSKFAVGRSWLPWAATIADASLAVYVIADHLPREPHDAILATDAVSVLPAFLLLLQTGMRLRRDLVAVFASLVIAGWLGSLQLFVESETLHATVGSTPIATRHALGFMTFAAAAGFVLHSVHRMRMASAAVMQSKVDQMLLSRFLPEGVAAEVVSGQHNADVAERHACLVALDIRGFSAHARERQSAELIALLMKFRRIVHDSVSRHGGIIDKYLGDGVLAVFLEGSPEQQARDALDAVRDILHRVDAWNDRLAAAGQSETRVIAALHKGLVLAGVFDDGLRAEFTVLGPAMNALSRMERRAKEANVDVLASKRFLRLLPASEVALLHARSLERRPCDHELPDVQSVHLADRALVT